MNLSGWQRADLHYQQDVLHFADGAITDWVQGFDTPLFLYSLPRIAENVQRLRHVLQSISNSSQLLYAMKANRQPLILQEMLRLGCGIDACSLQEVRLALACGFSPEQISVTGCLSREEWLKVAAIKGVMLNLDSLSALAWIGERFPRREVGVRINPQVGAGALNNDKLVYCHSSVSKFGIHPEQFSQLTETINKYDLVLARLHVHTGCGLQNAGLTQYAKVQQSIAQLVQRLPSVKTINLGGGLGIPSLPDESPLNLDEWAKTINQVWSTFDMQLVFEPGEFLVRDAGILLTHVDCIERKGQNNYVFLNAGFNLAPEPAFYQLPCFPVPVIQHDAKSESRVHVVGNINEALDIWMTDHLITSEWQEGDLVALLNAGAYAESMASDHCLRGQYQYRVISHLSNTKHQAEHPDVAEEEL